MFDVLSGAGHIFFMGSKLKIKIYGGALVYVSEMKDVLIPNFRKFSVTVGSLLKIQQFNQTSAEFR